MRRLYLATIYLNYKLSEGSTNPDRPYDDQKKTSILSTLKKFNVKMEALKSRVLEMDSLLGKQVHNAMEMSIDEASVKILALRLLQCSDVEQAILPTINYITMTITLGKWNGL